MCDAKCAWNSTGSEVEEAYFADVANVANVDEHNTLAVVGLHRNVLCTHTVMRENLNTVKSFSRNNSSK